MHMDEFALIDAFFKRPVADHRHIDLAVGDDAALFRVDAGHQCVVSSDMLVENRHFFADVAPRALGHKVLAVNLSDLAAMAAQPLGFTLSLGLPSVDEAWLAEFSSGLLTLADEFACPLIGGDTTQSRHLVMNITVFGQVPIGQAVRRDGARAGDDVWVSGTLGDAAYGLNLLHSESQHPDVSAVRMRLEMPTPRVALGLALRGVATSMLDLSDGLAGDLRHILRASNVGTRVDCDALPLSPTLKKLPSEQAWNYALTGGDDYELCFTAPVTVRGELQKLAQLSATPITRVGTIIPIAAVGGAPNIEWHSEHLPEVSACLSAAAGFNHFAGN